MRDIPFASHDARYALSDEMNVALMLPLFHEYSRNLRQGVLEWVDQNPGWRVIEIQPDKLLHADELISQLDGVITWIIEPSQTKGWIDLSTRIPVIDCGLGEQIVTDCSAMRITFSRDSINCLAVGHFRDLGLEVSGYVGIGLRQGDQLVPRVRGMKDIALAEGMEWVCHDLGTIDPGEHPQWLWTGHCDETLVRFLRDAPKPLGLLAQDDYIGAMLCETALLLGIEIPGEVAVIGQGNRVVGQAGRVPLSSVIIPGHEIGLAAAELLNDWMKGKPPQSWRQTIACRDIAVRRSTGGLSLDLGIERAKRRFDRNALEGVTVQELAAIAKCSPKTLRTRFQGLYGIEIARSVRERRAEAALKMLAESDLEIAEIGRRCGFPSAPNFFNFITRQTGGIGPTEYRRQAREGSGGEMRKK